MYGCLASCAVVIGGPEHLYMGEGVEADAAEATGYLTASDGYALLTMTRDLDGPCVGLLPTPAQYAELTQKDRHFVRVLGRFEPGGCGGDFICHDTCGPAVFTRIDAVQSLTDRAER